jgi:hypothetical protein
VSCVPCPKRTVPVFRPSAPLPGRLCFAVLIFVQLIASVARAQSAGADAEPARRAAAIFGRVIDARDDSPVPFARLYLESTSGSEDTGGSRNGSAMMFGASRTVVTDAEGIYSLGDLEPGTYRLHVHHPGYTMSSVDVDLTAGVSVRITIGIEFSPIRLPGIAVFADPVQPYLRTMSEAAVVQGARRTVERQRQAEYLEGDVRTLTAGDVQEAITLAEADLFRALQRVPGVTRRDDYTAVLWTRGAPWVHTRVYFDGMPLYNPTHGGWLFSAVNPDGVGAAVFQPGVRSAAWGEGAAGILDLQSRTGSPSGTSWRAEASLASLKLAGDGGLPGGVTWMIAGRRTYVDVLSRAWEAVGGSDDLQVPYDFADLIGRVDIPVYRGLVLEASGLVESDRLRGDIPDLIEKNRADWGNSAGRLTLLLPLGPVRLAATTGGTRFASRVDEIPGPASADPPTLSAMESIIKHDRTSLRIEGAADRAESTPWAFGVESVTERLTYSGPFSLTGEGIPGLRRRDDRSPFDLTPPSHDYTAYWGEGRIRPIAPVEVRMGLRIEEGESLRNVGRRRVAPRISTRWMPAGSVHLSAGWGRSFQYTQAIGAMGGPLGPQLHIGSLWTLVAEGYPALRADVYTAGAERWFGDSWLIALNGYRRDVTGVLEPDPTPGPIGTTDNPVEGRNQAWGVELSARRLVGSWTLNFGYAYGESEMRTDPTEERPEGMRYSASADVRHTADLTSSYRFGNGLRVGGAFSFASGVPYTQIVVDDPPRLEEPYAQRTPHYHSLDLMVDYATRLGDNEVSAYIQLLNTLGRKNAVTYAGSHQVCPGASGPSALTCPDHMIVDDFRSGLPRLPLIGFRIAL